MRRYSMLLGLRVPHPSRTVRDESQLLHSRSHRRRAAAGPLSLPAGIFVDE
jgi:hypothetical protein